jgi:hypothetical protein
MFGRIQGESSPDVNKEALVILPGITATSRKQAFLKNYFNTHTDYDVFLPCLWQGLGIRGSAWQLHRFLDRRVRPTRYAQVNFLSYISGGFILRAMLSRWPLVNVGHIVHVRSPLQEQVPGLVISTHGRVAAFLVKGRMMFDLASTWKDRLPFARTRHLQGLILERRVSEMAAKLGLNDSDFDGIRNSGGFVVPVADETLVVPESHDQVYTSEVLLARMVSFFKAGRF